MTALLVLATNVRADDGNDGDNWSEFCKPCVRLIDDFAPELNTTSVQEVSKYFFISVILY